VACEFCREDHGKYPSVPRALEILEFKEHRKECKRRARRWLEAVYESVVAGLPDAQDCEALLSGARWIDKAHPNEAAVLTGIAEKAERARRRE